MMFNTIPCNPFPPSSEQSQASGGGGGSALQYKLIEYTGNGQSTRTFELGENAKQVIQLSRKDGAIWLNPFSVTQTQTRVIWRTPNTGENNVTLSFSNGVLTVTGTDAGQACNSGEIVYVLAYLTE